MTNEEYEKQFDGIPEMPERVIADVRKSFSDYLLFETVKRGSRMYLCTHCGETFYEGEREIVAGKTVDQNYMLVDYPAIIKAKGLNGYTFDKHDINKDGKVNSKDLVAEMKAVASGETDPAYDLNSDGKVNSKDAIAVMKKIAE